jgi:hypothetical protein
MARSFKVVREATAQADAGQTDTVTTPGFARTAIVYLNVTDAAGTTPLTDMKFQYRNPVSGNAVDMQWNGITQIAGTTAGNVVVVIGGSNVDTEDDTGPIYFVKDPLPMEWNIVLTLDRTSGNEQYTYSLSVEFME